MRVRVDGAQALTIAAQGGEADTAKPFKGVGSGIFEIALRHRGDAYRVIYDIQIGKALWVIHAFQKKSKPGIKTPPAGNRPDRGEAQASEGGPDLRMPNPEIEQFKAILAAKIIGVLDQRSMTVKQAHELTGYAAADFSRVRQAKLSRFTIDRLMAMLGKLDQDLEVSVSIQTKRHKAHEMPRPI